MHKPTRSKSHERGRHFDHALELYDESIRADLDRARPASRRPHWLMLSSATAAASVMTVSADASII